MSKRIICLVIVIFSISCILSSCSGGSQSQTTAQTASEATSELLETTDATADMTKPSTSAATQQTDITTSETKDAGFVFEKLDKLNSYKLIMTMEAQAGPAVEVVQKFEAVYDNTQDACYAIRYMAEDGETFVRADENIVIGDSEWVKGYGKDWEVGTVSLADSYTNEFTLLYIILKKADINLIDESQVGGIPAVHYSFSHGTKQDSENYMKGEIWIANQNDLPPVIIKAFFEQAALDEDGEIIEDARYIKAEFEVSEINTSIAIESPL